MQIAFYLLAFFAGAGISVQAIANSQLAKGLAGNTLAAAVVSFCIGLLLLLTVGIARGGLPSALSSLPAQPLWTFIGGLLGALFLFSTAFLAPRIGLTTMLVLIILGQLLASVAIDHFGWLTATPRPVSVIRLLGLVIFLLGVTLTLFGDRLLALRAG